MHTISILLIQNTLLFWSLPSPSALLTLYVYSLAVSGSEDANVYFYDLTRPKHTCVNKLQVSVNLSYSFHDNASSVLGSLIYLPTS